MEIDPKEIRMGNWIKNQEGEIFQSTEYTPLVIVRENRTFEGVLIQAVWLMKLGFTYRDGWEDRYVNDRLKIYGNPMKEGWTIENIEPNFEIKYVHQLQNLYFSLTGSELVVPSGSAKIKS